MSARGQPIRMGFLDALEEILRQRADRRDLDDRRLLDRDAMDRRGGEALADRPPPAVAAHALTVVGLAAVLVVGLMVASYHLAPFTYRRAQHTAIAEAFAAGTNYGVFDLNIDTRGLRREHLQRMATRPELVVYGASHWQEADASLVPNRRFYNAHVHRDYHEDLLAVVEMMIRNDRLPDTLIISIRDLTFASLESRDDYLWLTGLPDYRSMAVRLGLELPSWLETRPERHYLGLFSLPTMIDNLTRWWTAPVQPGPTRALVLPTQDVLRADGSIGWSEEHQAQFTPERARTEVEAAYQARHQNRPEIDPAAVTAVDRVLGLLAERGVRTVLIHPPFNPDFHARIVATPYGDGLLEVEALTRQLAAKHGALAVGSFDPAGAGCTPEMYIDAEHSKPACLGRVLAQVPGL